MTQRLLHTLSALLIMLTCSNSHGAIMLINDPALPASVDGFNITRDTSTGIEWLDLDLSAGRTFNDLTGGDGSNEFIAGGDFEGFRYATRIELTGATPGPQVDSLYKSLGISPFGFAAIGEYANARSLITIAGCFGSCAMYGYSWGILLDDDGVTESAAAMEAFTSQGRNWGRSDTHSGPSIFSPNDQFPVQFGNWLVRPASVVPLPAPILLMLSGMAVFAAAGAGKRTR